MRTFATGLFVLMVVATAIRAEEAKKEGDANATQAVKDALKALFPEGEVKNIAKEQKGKLRRFNAEVQDKDGLHKVKMRADGSVLERSDPVKPEAIPAAVTTALKTKAPKGKATAATKYTIRGKVTWEIEYDSEGAKSKAYFAEDGTEAQPPASAKDDEEDK